MKAILLISIVALTGNFTFSQFQDINWVFGDSIGLNFSTEPPSFFETSILTYETNACISDSIGNLLFYTNGGQIWNKNHTLMSNGSGLDIPGYSLGNVTQGAIIIPVPLNENIYYLIQKSYPYNYSVIDLNLEGSLGKVIEKNIQLQSGFNPYNQSQKMNLIKHGNGRDWWLVFPAYPLDGGADGFGNPLIIYLFLINPYTIQLNTTFEGVIYEEQNSITTPVNVNSLWMVQCLEWHMASQ